MKDEFPQKFQGVKEQRRWGRKMVQLECTLNLEGENHDSFGRIMDVSLGGVKVLAIASRMEDGTEGRISFCFGEASEGECVNDQKFRVAWKNGPFYGLEFICMDEDTQKRLKIFIYR